MRSFCVPCGQIMLAHRISGRLWPDGCYTCAAIGFECHRGYCLSTLCEKRSRASPEMLLAPRNAQLTQFGCFGGTHNAVMRTDQNQPEHWKPVLWLMTLREAPMRPLDCGVATPPSRADQGQAGRSNRAQAPCYLLCYPQCSTA